MYRANAVYLLFRFVSLLLQTTTKATKRKKIKQTRINCITHAVNSLSLNKDTKKNRNCQGNSDFSTIVAGVTRHLLVPQEVVLAGEDFLVDIKAGVEQLGVAGGQHLHG